MTTESLERKAKELALFHGGKIAFYFQGEARTNAYNVLTSERRWSWPWGLHTGDLLDTYVEHHWRDFLEAAAAQLNERQV